MSETKTTVLVLIAALMLTGCRTSHSNVTIHQQTEVSVNSDVVAKKPFIAMPHPFTPEGAQPSLLLRQHARTDSPVPLLEFSKQKAFSISAFDLRSSLSAYELEQKMGPPAQLADYSDPWLVYRLNNGKELWLHFSQPDNLQLLAADIVHGQEDGYTRDRVFSADGTR
jgi:hypothetical protein